MTQRWETESGEASPEVSSGRCRRARQLTPVPWCSGALVLRRAGARRGRRTPDASNRSPSTFPVTTIHACSNIIRYV